MRCSVCARKGAGPQCTVGGTFYGNSCGDKECKGLLWVAHFDLVTNADNDTMKHTLWLWQARRAAVEGRTFLLPMPETDSDITARNQQRMLTEGGAL